MNTETWSHAMKIIMSLLIILAFFSVIAALLLTVKEDLPPGVREVLLVLVGVLAGAFKDVISYWIGSSASSSKKTDALIASKAP